MRAMRSERVVWVAFARTGKTAVAGQPAWPVYDARTDLIMDFTNTGAVAGPDPWKARLDIAQAQSESGQSHKGSK